MGELDTGKTYKSRPSTSDLTNIIFPAIYLIGKQLIILSPTFKSKYLAVSFEDSIKSDFFNLISLGFPVEPEVLVNI